MVNFDLIFKAIAILHSIVGCFLIGYAAHPETKPDFYGKRNPLVGDIYKCLAFAGCWALVFCGVGAFLNPVLAVVASWTSFVFYILTAYVDPIVERRWPSIGKATVVNLVARAVAAGTLTSLCVMLRRG